MKRKYKSKRVLKGLKKMHTSKGWMPINEYLVVPYKGKFGEGYTLRTPLVGSKKYHSVTYYIREDNV